jgi:Cu2+-exporting ATPase
LAAILSPSGLPQLPALSHAQIAGLDDPALLAQCVLEAPLGSSQRRIGLGLSGMYCAACAITIEDALQQVPGVTEVQVQAATQRARILLDPARTRLSRPWATRLGPTPPRVPATSACGSVASWSGACLWPRSA